MVVRRQKKSIKFRGRTTHGYGSRKKHRGAGSRGGRGRAGSGKRSGHKKNIFGALGKKGFTSRHQEQKIRYKTINVGDFSVDKINKWIKERKAAKTDGVIVLDLKKLGYDKLLGAGTTYLKLRIIVPWWSVPAAEKIKAAGGEVISTAVAEA